MKKIVRKLCLGLGLVGIAAINLIAEDYNIKSGDIKNFYNFKEKKCDTLLFSDKANIIKDIRNGYLIVDEHYRNDAGETYILTGAYDNGKEYEMVLTSSYNQCRFYEDLVIKKMDVKAIAYMDKPVKTNGK